MHSSVFLCVAWALVDLLPNHKESRLGQEIVGAPDGTSPKGTCYLNRLIFVYKKCISFR